MDDHTKVRRGLSDFELMESKVRSYSRSFPVVFQRAYGATLEDEDGNCFIDFLAGAGALNYGHNHPALRTALVRYMLSDGISHGLDMATDAKRTFMRTFNSVILQPRNMEYKLQFTGPTGANAVEAALKIARKVTGRHNVVAFTNGYHGVSLGALAVTGNRYFRGAAGTPLSGASFLPYDGYLGAGIDTTEYLDKALSDESGGLDRPAAVIVESIQGEGGINVASDSWMKALQSVCHKHNALLIVDEIQMGCGRTGEFFSFERTGVTPDVITLSKSLSGYGMPLSVVLLNPEWDKWQPGEHSGTFRGNNLAFVTATAALELFWKTDELSKEVRRKGRIMQERLQQVVSSSDDKTFSIRGRGMVMGLDCGSGSTAGHVARRAFERGLVVERCGAESQVIKFLPPLTIDDATLQRGLDIIEEALNEVPEHKLGRPQHATASMNV